ncbi:DUF6707 family protein [Arthrobacter sp. H5]|uniref:DUF6707 family protein n=1 Tax=Arthrobacter sp. H5 TaxID=1267973 RepID=UPI0004B3A461|nr:DUF6707 family protein [Arthrobacter sp. H5]
MIDSGVSTNPGTLQPLAAEAVSSGQKLIVPGRTEPTEVVETAVEHDDFGVPALVLATLETGETVRIAAGSTVQAALPENHAVSTADVGSPEALIAQAAAVHPESPRVHELADRLAKGVNFKSGSNLQDIRDLALTLFVDLADAGNALRICNLLTDLPFDGNFGRWKWIEGCLALAAHLTYDDADPSRSEAYVASLRAADHAELDPLRNKLAAAMRQRQLNEPNLYDPEIARSAGAGTATAEKEWRTLRLVTLLHLRAHGGSETLAADVLDRRVANELLAIRSLKARLGGSG